MLAGPTGVGKTRLARELLVGADRRGLVTGWVTATQAARVVPLGAFAAVVGDTDGPPDVSTLARASALVQREIDLLVVDDAHLLDEVSATLLHQLAVSRAAGLIVTVRTGEPTSGSGPGATCASWEVLSSAAPSPISPSRWIRAPAGSLLTDLSWRRSGGSRGAYGR